MSLLFELLELLHDFLLADHSIAEFLVKLVLGLTFAELEF